MYTATHASRKHAGGGSLNLNRRQPTHYYVWALQREALLFCPLNG